MGMYLSMELMQQPTLRLLLQCKLCRQYIGDKDVKNASVQSQLFGNKAYSVCPSCGQEVSGYKEQNYKARVRRFLKRGLNQNSPTSSNV